MFSQEEKRGWNRHWVDGAEGSHQVLYQSSTHMSKQVTSTFPCQVPRWKRKPPRDSPFLSPLTVHMICPSQRLHLRPEGWVATNRKGMTHRPYTELVLPNRNRRPSLWYLIRSLCLPSPPTPLRTSICSMFKNMKHLTWPLCQQFSLNIHTLFCNPKPVLPQNTPVTLDETDQEIAGFTESLGICSTCGGLLC